MMWQERLIRLGLMSALCTLFMTASASAQTLDGADAEREHNWLTRITAADGRGALKLDSTGDAYFLAFGGHAYAPDRVLGPSGEEMSDMLSAAEWVTIAPFQGLRAGKVTFPRALAGQTVRVAKDAQRYAFWDQVIMVSADVVADPPRYDVVEAGEVGAALPSSVRALNLTGEQIEAQQQSLSDPHIPRMVDREMAWDELEALAYPLDFQKVLIASAHDPSPGFVYQNGQWLTTWLSRDLPKWTKEDHWFAPALLIGDKLVRPAPLSAETGFVTADDGTTLPMWTLRWSYGGATVRQTVFSHPYDGRGPQVYVRVEVANAPAGARLALGVGRRPNAHYWDNRGHERTPIPFFTLTPGYRQQGKQLVDAWGNLILESDRAFELESLGPAEMLLVFAADEDAKVCLRTPQSETPPAVDSFTADDYREAADAFEAFWTGYLRQGAQVVLPSAQWMQRIDIWQSQVAAITRVHYQGRERLSYGAYFYQAYFGPEEGWPIVALAQWGRADEAKRQAEIMLSAENRSKDNVHHQSRNGVFAWYAAEVARLSHDGAWLESIAPALIENAEWTISQRRETADTDPPVTRGLLPPHIYGGDIRDPATSLYAGIVCLKGLIETAEVFRSLGSDRLKELAEAYEAEARDFFARLGEVVREVVDRDTRPPFLPLALALPSLQGKHEGPYEKLTETKLGNYWNLFAPSVMELQLGLVTEDGQTCPDAWLLDYMQTHGGLWAGLPRFHNGLDAAYSIGVIKALIHRSARDVRYRHQALAGLRSFFLHAASRNGYTIPEVAGLFPYRLDAEAYERLVRESPWSFGMYDAERYLDGHISFTEPLGAAAGEALWLIRDALMHETRDTSGKPDGGLFLFAAVPGNWFSQGKEIRLENLPTYYGVLSLHARSNIDTTGEVILNCSFTPYPGTQLKTITIRLAPSGHAPRDVRIDPRSEGRVTVRFP